MYKVVKEIDEVIEDKKVELQLLKPPNDQNTNDSTAISGNSLQSLETREQNTLISLIGVPGKANAHIFNLVRKDESILETVNIICELEKEAFTHNKKMKHIKIQLGQIETRIEKLAQAMMENGENSKLLWKLLEEMPTNISKFGEDRMIKDVQSNLKQLRNDRSALLSGNIQQLHRQRSEMSTLIQNYNRVQKDEAGINRDVQNINNQVETLTNLGRSHAQALARHYTPTNLYTPFDICKNISNDSKKFTKFQKNVLASKTKKNGILQFKIDLHKKLSSWNYAPDNESDIKKHLINKKLNANSKKKTTDFEKKHQKDMDERQPYSSSLELAEICENLLIDTADVENDIIDFSLAIIDKTKRRLHNRHRVG